MTLLAVRHLLLGLAMIVAMSTLAFHSDAAQEALGGVYLVDGVNPEGTPYTGVMELTANGPQWQLRYRFEPHGEAVGIGLLQGTVLAVIFQTDGGLIGLSAFAIDRSKTPLVLRGQWTVPGHNQAMSETLTKTTVKNPALLTGPRTGV